MSRPTPARALASPRRLRRRLARRLRRRLEREVTAASVHAGLRAATATVAPLALAYATGRHQLVLAGVGGWLTCMADVGGAPRARARAMGAYVVLGALAYAGGVLASPLPAPAVALVAALVALGAGLLRAAGDAGATLGVLAGATFCAALATPAHGHGLAALPVALAGAGLLAAGSLWAMLLALVVWPVRPYAAARDGAAACYRALARFARGVGEAVAGALADGAAGPRLFTGLAREEHPRVRAAIQAARRVLVDTRRGRLGGSRRADDVALLLDGADVLFHALLTVAEAAEVGAAGAAAEDGADPALTADARALAGALALFGTVLDELADAVPSGRRAGRAPASLPAFEAAVVRLAESGHGGAATADGRGRDALRHAGALLEHAAGAAERAADVAATLAADAGDRRHAPTGWVPAAARGGAAVRATVRETVRAAGRDATAWARAVASPGAPVARHGLRLGVAVGVAQLLGALLHVTRGPWITITTLIVLQPSAGPTLSRSAARVAGTVAGGVVAALLAAWLRDLRLIAAAAFVLAGTAVALRTVHYGVFTFFLTPVFVLIAQPAPGDWALAGVRVVDTMLGGGVAVLAGTLLWPAWEAASLPGTVAAAVEAARAHLALAVRAATAVAAGDDAAGAEPAVSPQALTRARRRAGLAATAGEGALERLLAEPRGRRRGAALLALLARTRRVNGAATALAAFGPAPHAAGAARVAALGEAVDTLLADVVAAAGGGRAPGPAPAELVRLLDGGRGNAATPHAGTPPTGDVARTAERLVPDVPAWGTAVRVARHAVGVHAAAGRLFGGGRA